LRLYFDTSAFIALNDRSDGRHPQAREFYETLTGADRLLTSNFVIDETVTRLRCTIGVGEALAFADAVLKGKLYSVLYVDQELERAALAVMKRFRDKRLSFTDCTTIALVQSRKLDAVFAFDDDFAKAGLPVVP